MTRYGRAIGAVLAGTALGWVAASAATAAESLPRAPEPFKGVVNQDRDTSKPDWPKPVKAPAGAPNVVLILLDDVGFSASSTFGGTAKTPTLDSLAAEGLRYNSFHVTALCSPTRSALLTGRNHHEVGFGTVADVGAGYPGYNTVWNPKTASVAEVLKGNGYSTAAFGKWHNTPVWEISPVGPFERWPTSLGFEYFYGFQAGLDNQFESRLYRNTIPVEPKKTPEQGYHLTEDLADDAVTWLHQHDAVAPDKPFFLYFAPGATHSPHQVPKEWIAKYKGKFDQGWDKLREENFARQKALGVIPADAELTPRPAELPAWESLSADERRLLAREAEVYAAFLAHTDHQIGRVLDAIREEGKFDNTVVLYIVGDNGAAIAGNRTGTDVRTVTGQPASLEERLRRIDELGTGKINNLYAGGWAWADNTPFQYGKSMASTLGGTTDPLVVSWPAKIKDKGAVRRTFTHVNDVAPTLFELAGIKAPEEVNGVKQLPLEGKSFAATIVGSSTASEHGAQYFEMVGHRGIYKDGWWAGSRFQEASNTFWFKEPVGSHPWQLYDLKTDYSQAHDLAEKNPAKLKELVALFDAEAKRNQVYPLAPYRTVLPSPGDGRTQAVFRSGVERIPARALPDVTLRSHDLVAEVEIPKAGAEGVIVAEGGRLGGFSLYVKDGALVYEANAFGNPSGKVVSTTPLPAGKVTVGVSVTLDKPPAPTDVLRSPGSGPGTVRLSVNGRPAGEGRIENLSHTYNETLDLGKDLGGPVTEAYAPPFAFTGRVDQVTLTLK